MMDPSIGWYQSEHSGQALPLWKAIWKGFNTVDETEPKESSAQRDKCSKFLIDFCRLSDSRANNPSSTYGFDYNPNLIAKYSGIPWRPTDQYYTYSIDGLHQEIEDFSKYMNSKPEEHILRTEVRYRITHAIESLWNGVIVQCFGSFETGTYLPTSDIDLVVVGRWSYLPLAQLEQHLLALRQCLPHEIRVLDRAAVPIIKMTDYITGIRINISFNLPEVTKSVDFVKENVKKYKNAKKLVFIVKQFLLQRDLNEVFTGGLSSYSLVLMVVHFFQTHEDIQREENLGTLLMRFFELYGKQINYSAVGLNLREGKYVPKSELMKTMVSNTHPKYEPSLLCIEDPINPSNNVSKNSYAIEKVRDSFIYAYDVLYAAIGPNCATLQSDKSQSILGRIIRITDLVIDKRENLLRLAQILVTDINLHKESKHRNLKPFKRSHKKIYNYGRKGSNVY